MCDNPGENRLFGWMVGLPENPGVAGSIPALSTRRKDLPRNGLGGG